MRVWAGGGECLRTGRSVAPRVTLLRFLRRPRTSLDLSLSLSHCGLSGHIYLRPPAGARASLWFCIMHTRWCLSSTAVYNVMPLFRLPSLCPDLLPLRKRLCRGGGGGVHTTTNCFCDAKLCSAVPFYGNWEGCCTLCTRKEGCVAWSATNAAGRALVNGKKCVYTATA